MAKRATVQPRWMDAMLHKWGVTMPSAKGWYNVCPMLQSGIFSTAGTHGGMWEFRPQDFEHLAAAIEVLSHKHRCVIYRAYKPWTAAHQEAELARYGVTERTWLRWLIDAAACIESHMIQSGIRVCGHGHRGKMSVTCEM